MIFKTFNNDLDGIRNKIGFSKRSFAEWGTQIKTSFNEGEHVLQKFKNALTTAFISKKNMDWKTTPSGEIVSKNNIDSYLEALDKPAANNLLQKLQEIQVKVNIKRQFKGDYFINLSFFAGKFLPVRLDAPGSIQPDSHIRKTRAHTLFAHPHF